MSWETRNYEEYIDMLEFPIMRKLNTSIIPTDYSENSSTVISINKSNPNCVVEKLHGEMSRREQFIILTMY